MSWENELYAVYEKASALTSEREPLLPISHSTVKAQLEVTIDSSGNFLDAVCVSDEPKDNSDAVTVIPVTEDSGTRGNGIYPHPFADKLIYIAGDYCDYCNTKKGNEAKYYTAYIMQLKKWRDSEFTHPSVNALYDYLSKGTLIGDLVRARVLTVDDSGKLTSDKIQKIPQSDCFIRFIVCGGSEEERTWLDNTLYEKYIMYNNFVQTERELCYATGDVTYCTYKHPSKVLNSGDKGKLFSANDDSGYSYRGRFLNKEQAFSISYEFSQKMHNGLKWLIARQGVPLGSQMLVVWDSELEGLPNACADSRNLSSDKSEDGDAMPEIFKSYEDMLNKSIFGTKDINPNRNAMVLVLDEATTGRISVSLYNKLPESEFLNNIYAWHRDTAWYRFDFNQKRNYIGSFTLPQIAEFAYGTEQNGKVVCKPEIKNDTVLRLIPCVTEGRRLPTDILRQLVNRASRRTAYGKSWEMLLAIACGMIQKHYIEKGRDYGMTMDEKYDDSSYWFGCLIAVAEVAERVTYQNEEGRSTNAERYFERFSNAPATTWLIIRKNLGSYFAKMSIGQREYYKKLIDDFSSKIPPDDFNNDSKLSPLFLLGYSRERINLRYGNKKDNGIIEEV